MSAKAEREDKLPGTPFSINWCDLTDPPCPFKGWGECGIKETLRGFSSKPGIRKEAERLYRLAKEKPDEFRKTCERGLYG